MNNYFNEIFIGSATNTFIDVLTWVGISLLFFEILNMFTKDGFYRLIENHKKWQVVIAAFLGLTPGCGGALMLVPLYNKKKISFGALTAGFVATFGDASFTILGISPLVFGHLVWISFVAAIIWGYFLELTKLSAYIDKKIFSKKTSNIKKPEFDVDSWRKEKKSLPSWFLTLDRKIAPAILWVLVFTIFPGTIITISTASMSNPPIWTEKALEFLGYISAFGTFWVIGMHFFRKIMMKLYVSWNYKEHPHDHAVCVNCSVATQQNQSSKGKDVIQHTLHDVYVNVIFIGTWIFFGLWIVTTLEVATTDSINSFLKLGKGYVAIIVGIMVGLLPGCGPQIAFALLFFNGGNSDASTWLPLSALVGNAINQDGDAAFSLIATNPKSIIWMRAMNLIPAVIFATIVFGFESAGMNLI